MSTLVYAHKRKIGHFCLFFAPDDVFIGQMSFYNQLSLVLHLILYNKELMSDNSKNTYR